MKKSKVTEGVGYLSGDYECFCLSKIPFEEWTQKHQELLGSGLSGKGWDKIGELDEKNLSYPNDWFPKGFDDKKVRYRITIELEEVEETSV